MIIQGKSASRGIAIGRAVFLSAGSERVYEKPSGDPEREAGRFQSAREAVKAELLSDIAAAGNAETDISDILSAHLVMLEDPEFLEYIDDQIQKHKAGAQNAVSSARDHFAGRLASLEDPYLSQRAEDIRDLSNRLLDRLALDSGEPRNHDFIEGDTDWSSSVLFADELTPSQLLALNRKHLLALVLKKGSANSHMAILARAMNIPTVIGIGDLPDMTGACVIADADAGLVIPDPSPELVDQYRKKQDEQRKDAELLSSYIGKETTLSSGKRLPVFANIGDLSDLDLALSNDAEGIGLFRTEFLFLNASDYPTEEEQFKIYKKVLEAMGGKKVILRTLDIGADKSAPYFGLKKEANPALGLRGIRLCLERPDLFQTQLRALLRAACYGNAAIMFPMTTSLSEVSAIRENIEKAEESLRLAGLPFVRPELGLMIETPAAVMISDELAKEVDFFSIGTNDLTQYLLAADRQNDSVMSLYDSRHPAVLRAIELVIQNAHRANCRVGICGELAADLSMTHTLIQMGIDELSVAPPMVLALRRRIMETEPEA